MTYTIRKQLVAQSKYDVKCPYKMTPKYITVHNTANDASAANEVAYHNRNNSQVSYHIAIDDKEVVQCVPFDRNAWHCGDGNGANSGNRTSIGIEICYSKSGGARYTKAEANAVHYIATLLKQFGWGVDRLRQHYDWSRKNCPHRIRDEKRWDSFVKRVETELNALNKPTPSKPSNQPFNLTQDQRKACREIICYAVKSKAFSSAHAEVDTYTDEQLVKYTIVFAQGKTK